MSSPLDASKGGEYGGADSRACDAGASVPLAIRNAWRGSKPIQRRIRQNQVRQRYADHCGAGLRVARTLAAQILTGQRLETLTV